MLFQQPPANLDVVGGLLFLVLCLVAFCAIILATIFRR